LLHNFCLQVAHITVNIPQNPKTPKPQNPVVVRLKLIKNEAGHNF